MGGFVLYLHLIIYL